MSEFTRIIYLFLGSIDIAMLLGLGWCVWYDLDHNFKPSKNVIIAFIVSLAVGLIILYNLCGGL